MVTWVKRGNVKYPCKSEEQLKLFLDAGYTKEEEPEKKEAPKKTKKKVIYE